MSNRLSKGKVLAGQFAQDQPGYAQGGIEFSYASTGITDTAFVFSDNAVVTDVVVKITSVADTSQTISVGIMKSSSSGVNNAFMNARAIGSTGVFVNISSTQSTTFSYGTYLISSTVGAVTVLSAYAVGSTATYRNLSYTLGATSATVGVIYPIFHELS
jgi:hypothetical protein